MSADEDTELRDLVAQTLESNGVLGKIRAQLRASVFLALEEQESIQNKTPFQNQDLKKFMSTKEGHTVIGLVKEFLEFFNLEFTQAVFEPESGCGSNFEGRSGLAKELNLSDGTGGSRMPLLLEALKQSQGSQGSKVIAGRPVGAEEEPESFSIPKELTSQQLADARKKFEYYDRDKNNEIDKEELRDLFTDMFPSFNRNMLDRYVNDEFRAADRDISNKSYFMITSKGISFQEFISMYKRLFLQCRSVVAGDVGDILSPASPNKSVSSPISKASNSERSDRSLVNSRNQRNLENGPKSQQDNTDTEEDFFDDPVPVSPGGYKSFSSNDDKSSSESSSKRGSSKRQSQIPVFSALRSDEKSQGNNKATSNGHGGGQKTTNQGCRGQGTGGMSSLSGLPSLTGEKPVGRKSRQLPVFRPHTASTSTVSAQGDTSENLRAMDKRMSELGLDGDGQDYSYEDDFQSEAHSMSQKSPRGRSEAKSQNGSIAEEIEEDIEDLSIEGDDLLRSEKSGFDDVTTDRTISAHETGYDYMEDLQSP